MKPVKLMLAASIVCGSTLFSGCSDDNSANPDDVRFKTKMQAEFVKKTRSNLKEVAENLNFSSWSVANKLNMSFNEKVLTNPDFDKSISRMFSQQIQESIKEVDKDDELAKLDYTYYATVDLSKLKYQFSVNEDGTGFEMEEADNFELLLPSSRSSFSDNSSKGMFRVSISQSGSPTKLINTGRFSSGDTALVILVPEKMSFTIDNNFKGDWETAFSGDFKNEFKIPSGTEYGTRTNLAFNVTGEIRSGVPVLNVPADGKKPSGDVEKKTPPKDKKDAPEFTRTVDATNMTFEVGQDPSTHEANFKFNFVHNDRSIVELSAVMKNSNGLTDLSKLASTHSVFDVFSAIMVGNSVDEQKITILDDLTLSMIVKDCDEMLDLQSESASMRRNYATEANIKKYAEKMNDLLTISLDSKSSNQKIAVKLDAVEFGVDYWTMPMFKFSDSDEYVSLLEVLDQESMEYGINILDHAIDPMQDAIVVARQLLQYMQMLMGVYETEQGK